MDYATQKLKNELLQWIMTVEDRNILEKIQEIKGSTHFFVKEPQAEYAVKDDFEERWAKGLTMEESKARTLQYLRSLPWKK